MSSNDYYMSDTWVADSDLSSGTPGVDSSYIVCRQNGFSGPWSCARFVQDTNSGNSGAGGQPPASGGGSPTPQQPPQLPTVSITVNPQRVLLGQPVTLTWQSDNVYQVEATGAWSGIKAVSGSVQVTPGGIGNNVYGLQAGNPYGLATDDVTVSVYAPQTLAVAPPTTVQHNTPASLDVEVFETIAFMQGDLQSTGDRFGAAAHTRLTGDGLWNSADAAKVADGTNADVYTPPAGDFTNQLVLQDFGFDIPLDALITGVDVVVTGREMGDITDEQINLIMCALSPPHTECYNRIFYDAPSPPVLLSAAADLGDGTGGHSSSMLYTDLLNWLSSCGFDVTTVFSTGLQPAGYLTVELMWPGVTIGSFFGNITTSPPQLFDARKIRLQPFPSGYTAAYDAGGYVAVTLNGTVIASFPTAGWSESQGVEITVQTNASGWVTASVEDYP